MVSLIREISWTTRARYRKAADPADRASSFYRSVLLLKSKRHYTLEGVWVCYACSSRAVSAFLCSACFTLDFWLLYSRVSIYYLLIFAWSITLVTITVLINVRLKNRCNSLTSCYKTSLIPKLLLLLREQETLLNKSAACMWNRLCDNSVRIRRIHWVYFCIHVFPLVKLIFDHY